MNISTYRRISVNPYSVLFFSLLFLISTSCRNSFNSDLSPDYSGEELFEGIFFSKGKVAELIPEIKEYHFKTEKLVENQKEADAFSFFQSKIMKKIKQTAPDFFNQFKMDTQSGDHIRIKDALVKAGKLLIDAIYLIADDYNINDIHEKEAQINQIPLKEISSLDKKYLQEKYSTMFPGDKPGIYDPEIPHPEDTCIALALIIYVAVLAVLALHSVALVVILTAVWYDVALWSALEQDGTASGLRMERIVNSIAVYLKK